MINESNGVRVPVQERSRKTRERIVEAGKELFARKGYHQSGVKEIARLAGVAVGSFYAYFPDKAALFLEITEGYYQRIFARLQDEMQRGVRSDMFDSPGGRKKVVGNLIQALYHAHDIEPELHRELLMMMLAGGNDSDDDADAGLHRLIRERVDAMDREVQAWLEDIIRQHAPSAHAKAAAAVVFRSAEESIHRLKLFPETMPPADEVIAELSRMLYAYLFDE